MKIIYTQLKQYCSNFLIKKNTVDLENVFVVYKNLFNITTKQVYYHHKCQMQTNKCFTCFSKHLNRKNSCRKSVWLHQFDFNISSNFPFPVLEKSTFQLKT